MQASLDQIFPNAWRRKAWWTWLFLPLTLIYAMLLILREGLYRSGIKTTYSSPVPVMIVGNISVGGTGKTPLILALIEYLQARQLRVGVISRGYGGTGPFPQWVSAASLTVQVGDEPLMMAQSAHVPIVVAPKRQQAIELLLSRYTLDIILSDDGLQHRMLKADIAWAVIDTRYGLGNGMLLPVGPLREPASRLQSYTPIYHGDMAQSHHMILHTGQLYPINPSATDAPTAGATVYGVAGIGDPSRFFMSLRTLGFSVIECPFPDHHPYQIDDFAQLQQYPIITTQKDMVKILPLGIAAWVLPVKAQLSEACFKTLDEQLVLHGITAKIVSGEHV